MPNPPIAKMVPKSILFQTSSLSARGKLAFQLSQSVACLETSAGLRSRNRVHEIKLGENREFETDTLRYEYSSWVTPQTVYDYNMNTRTRELKKETDVLGFDL